MRKSEIDSFKNLLSILSWLQQNGWKIQRATIYKHKTQGKLKQHEDGTYYIKDVERYARTFLKRRGTGKRLQVEEDELQRKKAHLEIEKLEVEITRAKRKQEIEEGSYISRDQFEIELVSRAAVLDAGIGHFFQSNAGNWIHLVDGDRRKLPELIGVLMAAKDGFMNQYARPQEFVVEIGEETDHKVGDE